MLHLSPLDTETLRDDWPAIVPGLESIIKGCQLKCIPEDIYREISSGSVYFFWVMLDGDRKGFVVLSSYQDRYSKRDILSVDFAFFAPYSVEPRDVMGALRAIGEECGAKEIEWMSVRQGWEAVADRLGCDTRYCVLSRDLDDE